MASYSSRWNEKGEPRNITRTVGPSANRILSNQWSSYCQEIHRNKLRNMKSSIDMGNSKRRSRRVKHGKRQQMDAARNTKIQSENVRLIRKILDVDQHHKKARTRQFYLDQTIRNKSKRKSSRRIQKAKQMNSISEQNKVILDRILRVKSKFRSSEWKDRDDAHKEQLKRMKKPLLIRPRSCQNSRRDSNLMDNSTRSSAHYPSSSNHPRAKTSNHRENPNPNGKNGRRRRRREFIEDEDVRNILGKHGSLQRSRTSSRDFESNIKYSESDQSLEYNNKDESVDYDKVDSNRISGSTSSPSPSQSKIDSVSGASSESDDDGGAESHRHFLKEIEDKLKGI